MFRRTWHHRWQDTGIQRNVRQQKSLFALWSWTSVFYVQTTCVPISPVQSLCKMFSILMLLPALIVYELSSYSRTYSNRRQINNESTRASLSCEPYLYVLHSSLCYTQNSQVIVISYAYLEIWPENITLCCVMLTICILQEIVCIDCCVVVSVG